MPGDDNHAYVPGFEYDVFISYAWVNNYPEQDDKPESGWVTRFKKKLQQYLDERLGRLGSSRIFLDIVQLGKNQDFDPQIETSVKKSAVFVALFSDGYIASPGCRNEIKHFSDAVGGNLPQSGRFFLARIDHVDRDSWPEEFAGYKENLIGYDFGARDPINDRFRRFRHGEDQLHRPLEDLRTDVAEQLKKMRKESGGETRGANASDSDSAKPDAAQPTVLVSQTTADLRKQRKQLISYCGNAQLSVLGLAPYKSAAEEFQEAFRADLQRAHLFVQPLGEFYSDRTEGFSEGKEQWQLNEARASGISILQWRDADLEIDEIDDQDHLKLVGHPDVRSDPPAVFHKDVVDRAQRAFDAGRVAPAEGDRRLALIKFNEADEEPTKEMLAELKLAHINCRSTHNGRSMVDRLRENHYDALVVVLGNPPADWLEERGDELMAVELDLKEQAPLRAYYYCGESSPVPPYVGQDVLEIHGRDQLDQLVQAIKRSGGNS